MHTHVGIITKVKNCKKIDSEAGLLFINSSLELIIIADCGDSYDLDNGYVNFDGVETTFDHTIPVTCEEGYVVEGEPHITCLASGAWSTNTQCRIVGKCLEVGRFRKYVQSLKGKVKLFWK